KIAAGCGTIVIGESIPGGTTTALMLLRSLGYDGTVSSAGPVNPLSSKEEIWNRVSGRLRIKTGGLRGRGLYAAAEVGDPMQVSVASFVAALPKKTEVVLAGGTQMMAVAALIRDMKDTREMLVATTKYVADDKNGCFAEYGEKIGVECYAAPFDFSKSKYQGLADYEKGFVKEGVGMGGAAWYAMRSGADMEMITARSEKLYEDMVK
ncbi:MAG: nicotinate-nucleotide--dimethylbenzimidazole phosphoribosyltransferase, partial [Synergistaceae bacterium]|nr:nicotinate-nucleotide--dimethylbenzimidazole phosphoribosyltransferase [Synergistaceae bacterium]